MIRQIVLGLCILISDVGESSEIRHSLQEFIDLGYTLEGPFTQHQVEQQSMVRIRQYPDIPQIPFGHVNSEWLELKAQAIADDLYYWFRSLPPISRLGGPYGDEGYIVVREGKIINILVTTVR